VDLVIIARGGGSAEDLWCFNDESLARAVHACPLPVVSAIGHETDFTILDFVADVRAATPTAAAELVAPDRADLLAVLAGTRQALLTHLKYRLYNGLQQLDDLGDRINWQKKLLVERQKNQLDLLAATLRQHDPRLFLEKGFSMTLRNGKVVRSAADARPGDVLETILADGRIRSVVVGEEARSEE
jgi:exodeoxyribonuclease VII large subunit